MLTRLLYCETQGCFHYEDLNFKYNPDDQYKVVDWCVNESVADSFIRNIRVVQRLDPPTIWGDCIPYEIVMMLYCSAVVIPGLQKRIFAS